jgi:aminopeptidase N
MHLPSSLAVVAFVLPLVAHAADPHSYAQPDQVVVTHLDLDLKIDFPHEQLLAQAVLTLDWKNPLASALVLDTHDLKIAKIEALAAGKAIPLKYALAPRDKQLGSKLTIATPQRPTQVRIVYSTSPAASGLQWLTPAQTADKKQPFMFSQSYSNHARTWVPLQDSPAIRFTYDAHVTAPKDIRVVMSALNDAKHPLNGDFSFDQPHPIPSYLLAIGAGDIAAKEIGPHSAVYAEPSVVGKTAHEFEDIEKLMVATEQLCGAYPWGRYDLLVLPPSFPYGGMENPNMTFVSPTLLVGDKSLVWLVTHELAHSWSGNLVTIASWRNIWINEGIATYLQGRITESLSGKSQADEIALVSAIALRKKIGTMPHDAQRLALDPHGIDADDLLSDVSYYKGSWFMRALEQRFGRDAFDDYLKGYFAHFAFQSITTEQMLDYMKAHLIEKYPGKMNLAEVQEWIYGGGIPDDAPLPDSPRFDAIDEARSAFLAGRLTADRLDAKGWNTQEWMYFLDHLPDTASLPKMQELDTAWHLTGTPNAEIGMRWYSHAIAAGDTLAWPAAAEHMTRIGRLYLTLPLYQALVKTPAGLDYAEHVYVKAKGGYHPLTQRAVEAIFAKAHKSDT